MTLGVATVLSARDWEPELVAYARTSASVRIVVRAYQPQDIDRYADEIEVAVAGGDVSWVTPAHVASWKARGIGVIGVVPEGDAPAARVLESGGIDEVVPDSIDPAALVQAIRFVAPQAGTTPTPRQEATITAVVGARGAPGCTEVAIAYALSRARDATCVLIDVDVEAPAVAVRLGLPPRPDLTDAADSVRANGDIQSENVQRVEDLDVITGSHRPDEPRLKDALVESVTRAARGTWVEVVLDVGASSHGEAVLADADEAILVVDASPIGIVRAAERVAGWIGPAPALVLNRVPVGDQADVIDAARRWTGLEPAVVLAERRQVRRASSAAKPPERKFARALGKLGGAR